MDIKIHKIGREALLFTPYNAEFIAAVKNIGGAHWDREHRAWSIPAEAIEQARDIMRRARRLGRSRGLGLRRRERPPVGG